MTSTSFRSVRKFSHITDQASLETIERFAGGSRLPVPDVEFSEISRPALRAGHSLAVVRSVKIGEESVWQRLLFPRSAGNGDAETTVRSIAPGKRGERKDRTFRTRHGTEFA